MESWKKRFWVFGFPLLLWMSVIFCFSSVPGRYLPRSYLVHHLGHLVEYFVFGVLLARALAHLRIKLNVWMLSLLSIVLILIFAVFDEWRQSFVPGRHARIDTIFFDGVYATLGVAIYSRIVFVYLMQKRKNMRSRRESALTRSSGGRPPEWL
jgi:VanZ family protein